MVDSRQHVASLACPSTRNDADRPCRAAARACGGTRMPSMAHHFPLRIAGIAPRGRLLAAAATVACLVAGPSASPALAAAGPTAHPPQVGLPLNGRLGTAAIGLQVTWAAATPGGSAIYRYKLQFRREFRPLDQRHVGRAADAPGHHPPARLVGDRVPSPGRGSRWQAEQLGAIGAHLVEHGAGERRGAQPVVRLAVGGHVARLRRLRGPNQLRGWRSDVQLQRADGRLGGEGQSQRRQRRRFDRWRPKHCRQPSRDEKLHPAARLRGQRRGRQSHAAHHQPWRSSAGHRRTRRHRRTGQPDARRRRRHCRVRQQRR